MADKIQSKMEQEQPCWYTVTIPQSTTRSTFLQRITTLSEKSKNNLQILVHFKNDRACFRFLNENVYCSLFQATGLDIDPDSQDTYIVQYGRDVLKCKFFNYFFPKGRGRQMKYTHLPSSNRSNLENAEVIKQCSEVNVSVNDKTVSVKTGESQLDFQEDAKENYDTCREHLMKVIPKCEASTLGSPARDETELLAEKPGANQNNPCLSNTDNFKTSAEAMTIDKELLHTEKSHFAVDIYGKELNSMNSDILELSTGNSATRTKIICQLNAGDEARTPHLKSGEGAGPTGSLQKARKSTAYVNFFTVNRKVGRKATKKSAWKKTGTFKMKSRKHCKKSRKKKSQQFLKKRRHYNTCQGTSSLNNNKKEMKEHRGEQIYSVICKEQIELPEIQEKKSKFQKTSGSGLKKKKKRGKKYPKEVVGRKIEKVESVVEKRTNDEEIVKRRQKKPFRSKGWSWNMCDNFKEKYLFDEDAFTQSLFRGNTDKYSKEIIKMLRELTDLLYHERIWKVNAYVYPSRRGKSNKSAQRRNQQGRTHGSQAAEGIPDQYPTQVSDAATASLNLPPAELVHTSSGSIFQTYTSNTPAPTTNLMPSIDAERGLVSRIRGQLPESRFSRPQQPPRHPQYADQPSRQRSYSNWPTTNGQDPTRMAIYGFFYTGRFDLIRCFQCGIGLKDWAAPDEPLFEHIKHSPDCQFLKDLLGQELLNAYRDNLLANQLRQTSNSSGSAATSTGPTDRRIRNPQYSDLEARLSSFDKWPATSLQRPQSLADAGLFFTGFNDLCRCFTCDGGLQRWDADDDPWIEHARWFPHCAYVRQIKGQEYINMVQEAARQAREEEEDPAVVYPPPGRRQGRGPIEQGMAELRLEDTEPLNTLEAQRVIGMGYSRRAVLLAIHEFNGQAHGERNDYSAADLVRILTERQDRGEALPPDSPGDSYSAPAGLLLSENMDPEEENRRLKGILKCLQCEENDTNILFLPCTHHRLCEDCAENAVICPVCGRKIDEKIKTFMS